MPEKGLICRNVCLVRKTSEDKEKLVLYGIDAVFPAGALRVISGPIGAGKSSLVYVLSGILRPSSGEVLADGDPVSRWVSAHRDRWRRKVGIVFQQPHLLNRITALENIMLPLVPRGRPIHEVRTMALDALDRLGGLDLAGRPVASLSGGSSRLWGLPGPWLAGHSFSWQTNRQPIRMPGAWNASFGFSRNSRRLRQPLS